MYRLIKGLQMTNFETNCYGMTEQAIREQYMDSITAKCSGLEMVVMGVLSDAQELLAMGRNEASRKQHCQVYPVRNDGSKSSLNLTINGFGYIIES